MQVYINEILKVNEEKVTMDSCLISCYSHSTCLRY